ncbi:MAG: hypothetical protein NVSMB4_08910 [Acidimicrobiales bacterium]
MTDATATMRRMTRGAVLGALVVLLASCALVTSTVDTTRSLQSEGFGSVRVIPTALNDGTAVRVTAAPPPGSTQAEQLAAKAVWEHYAFRFTRVEVILRGRTPTAFTRAQLLTMLGPRPAGYDRRSVAGSLGRVVAIVVGVGGVTVLVVVAIIAVFVVRRRRHKAVAAPPQGWPGYGPPGGYGPPPPGYGPPPPAFGPPPPGYGPPPPGYGSPPAGYGPPPGPPRSERPPAGTGEPAIARGELPPIGGPDATGEGYGYRSGPLPPS